MNWTIKAYLFLMALMYAWIGLWAILDPFFISLGFYYPSFLDVVGLSATSELGLSEIAGIYGGLNICIGFMCLIGMFKTNIGLFSVKFITFLVGSIAFGRILSSAILVNQDFFNTYFIFEVFAFTAGLAILYYQKN